MKSIKTYINGQLYNNDINEQKSIININEYLVGKITYYNDDYYKKITPIKTNNEFKQYIIDALYDSNDGYIDLSNLDFTEYDGTFTITMSTAQLKARKIINSIDVSNWKFGKQQDNLYDVFNGLKSLTSIKGLGTWDVSNIKEMSGMFYNCNKLVEVEGIDKWNTSSLEQAPNMFHNCYDIKNLDLSNWNTSKLRNVNKMFENCTSIKTVGISNWNLSKLETCVEWFNGCISYNEDLSNIDLSKVLYTANAFDKCIDLDKKNYPIGVKI